MLNGVSEKQITYAMKVRADALNALEGWREIFADSQSPLGKNLFRLYTAARELIESYTEARDVLDNAQKIVEEAKMLANDYETCYTAVKAKFGKILTAKRMVANYTKPLTYITADMFITKEA